MRKRREELRGKLTEFVLAAIDGSRELSDEELRGLIEQSIRAHTPDLSLSVSERITGKRDVFHALRGLDVLQEMMDDPDITDGTRKIEIPLYSVESLKMGLSVTSIFLRIPGRVANKYQFISF